ncbi:LysR family transcriptional regulator [Streptomyces sp. NPDC005485]|uniref:LysR family transcriptional regulator n=1 Tax=Streptomyces sp. NPDC005485 TaxID=3155591 RepID=UPI0033A3175F
MNPGKVINESYGVAMPADVLRNLDLNLLVTLDVLLQEQSVTRAAARLGVTQPAVSAALARLRRHFSDDLLRRSGNKNELTPLAQQLATTTGPALLGVQRVFEAMPTFDPASADREFTVMMSDYAAIVLGDHLATLIEQQAPGVRVRLRELGAYAVDHAMEMLRGADGMVLPHGFLSDIPSMDLFEDSWVLVVSEDNDQVGEKLTMDDLGRLPWVVTYNAPTAFTPALRQLRMIGVEPQVQMVVEAFAAVPFLVAGTNRIALLQAELAHRLAGPARVRILPCPWDVVPVSEAFWWHPMQRSDPAHIWLRSTLRRAGRDVTELARSTE